MNFEKRHKMWLNVDCILQLNVTNCGTLIDTVEIDKSLNFGCYGNNLVGNYEFLIYQNVCIYKLG